jgi:xylan 1,4-beta-xylosidase
MYDYAADAVKKALPTARIGGPHTTGSGAKFVEGFIRHCFFEKNSVTGEKGTPLDFVAFHAKGSPRVTDGVVRMGMQNQLKDMDENFAVIASFHETKTLSVIIGESDPEGCAACGMSTNPENAYRNGTLYSSYTAASIAREYDLAGYYGVNLIGAVNWSFEFENQPWFFGFRDLATNGVDKPVLNVFRMFGMMSGKRIEVSGNMAFDFKTILDSGVREDKTDLNALATKDKNSMAVMLWNYHDDDIQGDGSPVVINIKNLQAKKATLYHYRIDSKHSNSYEVWKKMGSPQNPSTEQIAELEQSGHLEMLSEPCKVKIKNNELKVEMQLPRQAVSLIKIIY